jgi:hypothetical protein
MRDERDEYPIHVGSDSWLTGTVDVRGQGNEPVAACGAWTAEDVYEVRVCFYAGVFCPVFRFSDASGVLRLDVEPNVSWDPPPAATIAGRVAD